MNLIPHSSDEFESRQPSHTPQNHKQIYLDSTTLFTVTNRRRSGDIQSLQASSIQNNGYECRIREHPCKHNICPESSVVIQFLFLLIDFLYFWLCFGGKLLEGSVIKRIEITVVEVELLIGLAVCDGSTLEFLRLIVAFCTPGDIVSVTEGINVDDICVGRGEEKILK
jgi:hypothetical protein